jgi:hypothetical protein
MGSFSNYWENKLLDYIFGKSSLTLPVIYIGLSITEPGEDGTALAEPSGNGYQREQTSASDWNVSAGGSLDNAGDIVFPMATGNWGTVTHFALFDAATEGNMLAYGTLSPAKVIGSGVIAKFAAGDLVINLD